MTPCGVAVPPTTCGLPDRFMFEIRAVTNLFSNIFATVVISRWMGELDDERLSLVLDGDPDDETLEEPTLAREAQG